MKLARYRVPAEGLLNMNVPAEQGHDDFLMSIALLCECVREWVSPVVESAIIRPRRMYLGEGRF